MSTEKISAHFPVAKICCCTELHVTLCISRTAHLFTNVQHNIHRFMQLTSGRLVLIRVGNIRIDVINNNSIYCM